MFRCPEASKLSLLWTAPGLWFDLVLMIEKMQLWDCFAWRNQGFVFGCLDSVILELFCWLPVLWNSVLWGLVSGCWNWFAGSDFLVAEVPYQMLEPVLSSVLVADPRHHLFVPAGQILLNPQLENQTCSTSPFLWLEQCVGWKRQSGKLRGAPPCRSQMLQAEADCNKIMVTPIGNMK